jgi:hypothetical protein
LPKALTAPFASAELSTGRPGQATEDQMPHYFLEGFENEWMLVRETTSSQKFNVKTSNGLQLAIDIHYTMPKVLTVNVSFSGAKNQISKSWMTPLFDEIGRIALMRDDYAVIDYTLVCGDQFSDGNFSIDKKDREIRKL